MELQNVKIIRTLEFFDEMTIEMKTEKKPMFYSQPPILVKGYKPQFKYSDSLPNKFLK